MKYAFPLVLALLTGAGLPASAHQQPDQARIVNSGSTNTAAWSISIDARGGAFMLVAARPERPFTVSQPVAALFFKDLAAAKASPSAEGPCMKSVSFGSVTRVLWHGWSSPDLSCPPTGPAVRNLAGDITQIRALAGVPPGPGRVIQLPPNELRRPAP